MKTFDAKYRGICAECDETIYPGDPVGYKDEDLIHKECDTPGPVIDITKRPRSISEDVCPVCSIAHAGECY